MNVTINDCALNVEVMGPEDGPVLIAHHGGGGIGSLAEPKATFGPLADRFRVVVFDARGCGRSQGVPPYPHAQWAADVDGLRRVDRRGQDRRRGRLLRRVHRPRVRRRLPRARPGDPAPRHLGRHDQPQARLRERPPSGPDRDQLGQLRPLLVRADPRRRGPQGALGGDHPALRLRVRPGPLGRAGRGGHLPARVPQLVLPAQHSRLRPQAAAPGGDGAHPGHRRPPRLGHPGQRRPDHRRPDAEREAGRLREVRPLAADRGARAVPVHRPRLPRRAPSH